MSAINDLFSIAWQRGMAVQAWPHDGDEGWCIHLIAKDGGGVGGDAPTLQGAVEMVYEELGIGPGQQPGGVR